MASDKWQAVISIGSNVEPKAQHVADAIAWLAETLTDVESSESYTTPPLRGVGEDYCNAVAIGFCTLPLEELNAKLKEYEAASGRLPGKIVIDLDIVMKDNEVLRPRDFQAEYFCHGYNELKAQRETV